MVSKKLALMSFAVSLAAFAARDASAQEAHLYHAHSGALLAFADAEATVFYNALLAKEFDPEIAKTLLGDLERAVNDAKRAIDRTRIILADEKLEPDMVKLLDIVKRAESQLGRLNTDVEEQTGEKEDEPSDHRDDDEGEDEPKRRDWNLLKNGASWVYQDIKDARAQHAAVGKKIKGAAPLKSPPKPAGKRGE
jgi:hypothetical protein